MRGRYIAYRHRSQIAILLCVLFMCGVLAKMWRLLYSSAPIETLLPGVQARCWRGRARSTRDTISVLRATPLRHEHRLDVNGRSAGFGKAGFFTARPRPHNATLRTYAGLRIGCFLLSGRCRARSLRDDLAPAETAPVRESTEFAVARYEPGTSTMNAEHKQPVRTATRQLRPAWSRMATPAPMGRKTLARTSHPPVRLPPPKNITRARKVNYFRVRQNQAAPAFHVMLGTIDITSRNPRGRICLPDRNSGCTQ